MYSSTIVVGSAQDDNGFGSVFVFGSPNNEMSEIIAEIEEGSPQQRLFFNDAKVRTVGIVGIAVLSVVFLVLLATQRPSSRASKEGTYMVLFPSVVELAETKSETPQNFENDFVID
mmetsp:Transcript_5871/g.8981  ORF Transcript_5871/g.8981 Transcript_5871/m.8981 type:complete len:116 (+) Transcript_5871:142-489(+)